MPNIALINWDLSSPSYIPWLELFWASDCSAVAANVCGALINVKLVKI